MVSIKYLKEKYRNIQVYINLFSVRSSNKSRMHRLETRTSKKAEKNKIQNKNIECIWGNQKMF